MNYRKLNKIILSIPEPTIKKVADIADNIPDCIRFDIGEPNFDMPIHLKQAAIKAIEEGFTHYTSNFGTLELRKAIAEKECQKNRTNISEDNIIVTPGGVGGLFCILKIILSPDDEVLIPDPSWTPYNLLIKVSHGRPVWTEFVKEKDVDVDNLEKNVTKKTKAIIVNNPQNPTGKVLRKDEIKKIVDFAVEHDLFIIGDEVYEKIIFDGISHYSLGSVPEILDRLFLINSFSKTYAMTGLRVGYVVAEEKFIKEMGKVNQAITGCVNSISQKIALVALQGSQDCVENMRKEYEERRNLIVKELKRIGLMFMKPTGTFYIFPSVNVDSEKFSTKLLNEKKVAVIPGNVFGPSCKNAIRISFGSCTKDDIMEGCERIERLIN
jgi:aspartate/methionine/tyrosine aminotransferase